MNLKYLETQKTSPGPSTWFFHRITLAVVALGFFSTTAVHAQLETPLQTLRKNYQQSIEELRTAIKAAKRAEAIHFHVESDEAFEYREQWVAAAEDAEKAYAKLRIYSVELFMAEEKPDENLSKIVGSMTGKLYADGEISKCYDTTKKLIELFPEKEGLQTDMARIAILNNDFETAVEFANGNQGTIADFPPLEKGLYGFIDTLREQFSQELAIRKAEAEADDLPRVELKTSKGDVVIELFENEAPETVGNFVNLVEIGFYNDLIFNPVFKNLMAHTGIMTADRQRPVGYTIYDEPPAKNARHHFRGSVCMATGSANTGSSVIYILSVPGPHLPDRQTVFGRVISGMEVIDLLQPTKEFDDEGDEKFIMEIVPDTILSATVIRKRDHEYVPNRVKESSETSK